MPWPRRVAVVLPVAALAVAVLAAPHAGAGMGSEPLRLTIAKKREGPYNFMASHAKVQSGPKDFFVKLANKTNDQRDILLEDVSHGGGLPNFKIRWFRGEHSITSDVQGSGYEFPLNPRNPKIFRAVVRPLNSDPGALCLAPRATVQPGTYQTVGGVYINDPGVCG